MLSKRPCRSIRLDRRTLLRGGSSALVARIALPALDAMLNTHGTAWADGAPLPVRFGIWYWGSGVHPSRFFPRTVGSGWELTPELAPLAKVRGDLNVLGNYHIKQDGVAHHVGTAIMKTGRIYTQLNGLFNTDVAVPSFDVGIARALGKDSPLPRLDVGVYSDGKFKGEGLNTRALAHNGPNSPIMAETNPQVIFDRLFMGGAAPRSGGEDATARAHLLARRSVLDLVRNEASALRQRLGAADQARIDQHLEAVRALEKRLGAAPAPGMNRCQPPGRPAQGKPDLARPDLVTNNRLMAELVTLAMACDLTRVFTFRHHGWTDDPVFHMFGAKDVHHQLGHVESGDQPTVHKTNVFTMQAFAVLLERLKELRVGDGSLLDRCAILAYSEIAEGRTHARGNIPLMVAGRAGGKLKTGLYHRSSTGESATKAHFTLFKVLGLPVSSFGEGPNRVTDGIAAIEA
jgi:hypothetical protein